MVCLLQRASPALADRLAGFCMQWLAGKDARMARAAAQMLGVLAMVEGARFGRRIPGLLKALLPALQKAAPEVCYFTTVTSQDVSNSPWYNLYEKVPSRH